MDNLITMIFSARALPDGGGIWQAADVLIQHQQAGSRLIAVVSALPGVSELLRESVTLGNYARVHNKLLSIHTSAARKLVHDTRDRTLLIQDISDMLETYNWMGRSMVNRSPTPSEAATMLSVGERLSARLLAGHLQNRGVRAVHPGEMIVTDLDYLAAKPDIQATGRRCAEKLKPLLNEGYIVIASSGAGVAPEGKLTRLNAPHVTGGLLAANSGAASLWYLTDQDGILTADPKLVSAAQTVPVIPINTLRDLADYGLPVPSGEDIAPAAAAHIPIFIRNLSNPTHPGTYIQPHVSAYTELMPVIVARRNVRWLNVSIPGGDAHAGIQALQSEGIRVLVGQAMNDSVNFFMNAQQVNIGRLALAGAYPAARIQTDSSHSALVGLIGMDTDSAMYLARHLNSPAQVLTVQGHPALLIPDETVEASVEKIHNLTLSQLK